MDALKHIGGKLHRVFKSDGKLYLNCEEWRGSNQKHVCTVLDSHVTVETISKIMDDHEAALEKAWNQ